MNEINLNGRTLNPVIDFDLIVNTDLGLIRFIRENYQDEKAFQLSILNKSDREILSLLYSRKNPNPLSVISTEENMKDIDPLYKSFFDTYKKDIIHRSTSEKGIMDFVSMAITSGSNFGINVSIAVNDDLEKEEIRSHFNGRFSFIMKDDKIGLMSKDAYYIKDYRFFTEHNLVNISRKKIHISPVQYGLDYFEDNKNPLTSENVLLTIGKDYKIGGNK